MAAEKFLQHDGAGGFDEISGVVVSTNDRIPSLNASGLLDQTMMPAGIGPDTAVLPAAGALSEGDFVNVFDDSGTPRCRLADASSITTPAHGFVLADVVDTENATVYFEGTNTFLTGLLAGAVYLSETAGAATNTAPTTSTAIVQKIGVATAATKINVEFKEPVLLA